MNLAMKIKTFLLCLLASTLASTSIANEQDRQKEIRRGWNEFINAWFPENFQIDCSYMEGFGPTYVFEKSIFGSITVTKLSPNKREEFSITSYNEVNAETEQFYRERSLLEIWQPYRAEEDIQLRAARSFANLIQPEPPKIKKASDIFKYFEPAREFTFAKMEFDFQSGYLRIKFVSEEDKLSLRALPAAGAIISGRTFTTNEVYRFGASGQICTPAF